MQSTGRETMPKKTSARVSSLAAATLDTGKAAVEKVKSLAGSVLASSKARKAVKARPKKRKAAKRAKK
jgi:hypothetical protein